MEFSRFKEIFQLLPEYFAHEIILGTKREGTYNMKTYKVGLIRVLTTEEEELLQLNGKLIESYFPMFQVVSRCIPEQPEGIHDDETFAVGVPKVVNLAVELWKEGCQAIIISCAGDPGVPEARQAVPIPVIERDPVLQR